MELLIVIGIIALLLALLLPSLSLARESAKRAVCMGRLQQVMVAAQAHLIDHKGFFPLAGVLPGVQPQYLDDTYSIKYDYFSYPFGGQTRLIAPITIALATEMSAREARDVLSNPAAGLAETDPNGFIRYFLCPSQAATVADLPQMPLLWIVGSHPEEGVGPMWYWQQQSYIYNEAALGYDDSLNRCRGQFSLIHQPSRTMFAADGVMGSLTSNGRLPWSTGMGMVTLYNQVGIGPVTMADALGGNGNAGDPENFDLVRHAGKIDISFCDGHVETHQITLKDLSQIYLMAP